MSFSSSSYQGERWSVFGIYTSEDDFNEAFTKLKQSECGRGVTVNFIKNGAMTRKNMVEVSRYRCAFYKAANCPYRVRVLFDRKAVSWTIETGQWHHSSHVTGELKRGVSLATKNLLTPTKKNLMPSSAAVCVAKGGDPDGLARDLTDKDKGQVMGLQKRLRRSLNHERGSAVSTWGAVARTVEKCTSRVAAQ